MYNILKLKLKSVFDILTKEGLRALKIMILGFILIIAIIIIKYKPVYEVKLNNETLGYVENKNTLNNMINENILNVEGQNIESVALKEEPKYEAKLIERTQDTNETQIIEKLDETKVTTYKFYAVTLNNKNKQDNSEYDAMADDAVSSAASAQDMAADAMAEAAGRAELNSSNLSTSLGSDRSSKSMNMSGAAPRLKPTFKSMASNSFRPMGSVRNGKGGQALAMSRANKAGTIGTGRAGSRKGSRAFGQAKAMSAMLARASSGSRNYETARATTDAAWEGTTAEGDATETVEAGGLGEGEGMTVDPIGTGAPGSSGTGYTPQKFDYNDARNVSPWQSTLETIQYLFMGAMGAIMLGAALAEIKPWGYIGYIAAAAIAAGLCIAVLALAAKLKNEYHQDAMADMWLWVGGISLVAAIGAAGLLIGAFAARRGKATTASPAEPSSPILSDGKTSEFIDKNVEIMKSGGSPSMNLFAIDH